MKTMQLARRAKAQRLGSDPALQLRYGGVARDALLPGKDVSLTSRSSWCPLPNLSSRRELAPHQVTIAIA